MQASFVAVAMQIVLGKMKQGKIDSARVLRVEDWKRCCLSRVSSLLIASRFQTNNKTITQMLQLPTFVHT